ncbi:MAG: VWA domain-containing protein [Candidatus Gracilibacteria bacterium]|nr:VWA domain-containing protein [Candidatus Gracilibacteria bacterium]
MIKFLHINYFFLLIPIVLFILLLYFKGGRKIIFTGLEDIKIIYKNNTKYYKLYYVLIFSIFLLFIIIFSKPVIENKLEKVTKKGIDIQIILDISYSMIAQDLEPNRLEVAKEVIGQFVDKIESDRVGFIVYSGKVFTSLPLSFDYEIIKKTIKNITINTINQNYFEMQGTATGDALILAGKLLYNGDNREKVIILVTDGEANKGINPLAALSYIKQEFGGKIRIYTIGIGGDKKTTISITNPMGQIEQMEIGGVNEEVLKIIANNTNGKFFLARDKESLENIFDTISKLEKREIVSNNIYVNKDKYNYFVYILIVLFLSFIILKYIKRI